MFTFPKKKSKHIIAKGLFKNPLFYFGSVLFVLFGLLFLNSDSLAQLSSIKDTKAVFFSASLAGANQDNTLFFSQSKTLALETPDLKILQDSFIAGVSTPLVLNTQTLGDIFGSSDQRKEVIDITVEPGNTIKYLAEKYGISKKTIADANNISENSALKTGQNITILPFSGVVYVVKSGDTLGQIAENHSDKTHQVSVDDIIADNNIVDNKIFDGDVELIRNGVILQKSASYIANIPLAKSFLMLPLLRAIVTQGIHYFNAVDLGAPCGTPVYASAAGVVQRAVFNGRWNLGMGNYVTILLKNGITVYNGHLGYVSVKPGDEVNTGDPIGLVGKTGNATGCHDHVEVIGAQNPFNYPVGTVLDINN